MGAGFVKQLIRFLSRIETIFVVLTISTTAWAATILSKSTSITIKAPTPGAQDFTTRCSQSGVVKCVSFDTNADLGNTANWGINNYQKNFGVMMNGAPNPSCRSVDKPTLPNCEMPVIDTIQKASGTGSLKFTIPSESGSGGSGQYWTNFSSDLSVQFGANEEFFVQWRQRFSPEYLSTKYIGGGWKLADIVTGDQQDGSRYNSCEATELVIQNTYLRNFPVMYNSCSGSSSHGPYDPFEESFGSYDFKLQNAMPAPYCLYTQSSTGYFPPKGNCFGFVADQWMTFQVHLKLGPRVNDVWKNSIVKLYVAREGQSSVMVFDWGNTATGHPAYDLNAGPASEDQKYGKVFLMPYHTGKDSKQVHPTGYTWYDDLIISRNKIADPK